MITQEPGWNPFATALRTPPRSRAIGSSRSPGPSGLVSPWMIRRRSATYWRAPKAPTMTEMDSPAATVSLSVYATIGSITWSSCLRKGFVEVLSRQISPAATEHVSLGLDQVGVDDIVDQLDRHSTLQGQASQPPSSVTILDDEHVLVAISGCIGDTGSSHHVQHALQSGAVITNGIGKE